MRVLHVIASTEPASGGIAENLRQLSVSLREASVDVEVASMDAPDAPWLPELPYKVYALGPGKGVYGYAPELLHWLKAHGHEYDAIVVDGIWQYNGAAVWLTRKNHRRPYFVFPHGMLDPYFRRRYPLKHLKKQIYWLLSVFWLLRDAESVFFTCKEEAILAENSMWPYHLRAEIVPIGTAGPAGFNLTECAQKFQSTYPDLSGHPFLLFLSRIHPKKGCDVLIRAYAQVNKETPLPLLALAGPDQVGWKKELKQLALDLGVADRICWCGMLQGDMKWGAFASCEAFVLPSHQENFGIVVAEALSCSKVVLISDKVNIYREVVEDGGGFAASDTVDGCASLLRHWVNLNNEERAQHALAARRSFENRFATVPATKVLADIYGKHLMTPQAAKP